MAGFVVLIIAAVMVNVVVGDGADDSAVDPGWLEDEASGKVAYCSGEDVSSTQQRSVDAFNRSADRGSARATLVDDISPKADGQRREYLKRVKDGACDVLFLDVIYTPEFASKSLLLDMSPYLRRDDLASTFDPLMMRTVTHGDKLWGVPKHLDGGVLYYRRDKARPPGTWRRLVAAAVPDDGERSRLRLQLDAYEGLTVVFLELAYAAGAAEIVSDDGRTATINQPGTRAALKLLQSAIARRALPRSVTRQGDAGSLWAFSTGRASFLRAWPYVESRVRADAEAAERTNNPTAGVRRSTNDNLGSVALPAWTVGGRRVGVLGGHNLVIPRTAKNPKGALHLIKFLTSEDQILSDARHGSLPPVLPDLWIEDVVQDSAALAAVRDEDLRLRPPITCYWQLSRTIYTALRRVLATVQSPKVVFRELEELETSVQSVLDSCS